MKKRRIMKRIGMLALVVALLTAIIPASALAAGYLEATGARVNVRSGPGDGYTDLYTLVRGETVSYTGESAYDSAGVKWYKVQYYSYGTGWVSSQYSTVYSDTYGSSSGSSSLPSFGGTSYVKAEGGSVNIRKSPNLTGADLGTMADGQTASYLGQSSTDDRGVVWYYVNYNGTIGWVSSRYSKLYGGASFASYVQAEGGDVNIRNTPSLTGRDLGTMFVGETAIYLGQSSTDDRGVVWYYVNYDGTIGWVSSRYSKLYNGTAAATRYVTAEGGDVNIRSTPSLSGRDLGTMFVGESAIYLNQSSTDDRGVVWYYVNCDGTIGWVSSRYSRLY